MATLDDKLLGEKLHYYCSSSEDEEENEPKNEDDSNVVQLNPNEHNTGPKGVLDDWRRYKQLEVEKREKDEREKLDLAKKLSLNCRSEREDSEINAELEKLENDVEDDDFIQGINRFYALSMGCKWYRVQQQRVHIYTSIDVHSSLLHPVVFSTAFSQVQ